MKLGIFTMPLHLPGRIHADTYDEDLELLAFADKLGYSEAWIGEHYALPWENVPAPDLFIARAIGETERIVLGTGVVLLQFHNSVHIAHRIAMLDHLARGRLYFGIGAGGSPSDYQMFGLDLKPGSQGRMMRESIEVILKLWTGEEPFEFRGEFFNASRPEAQPEKGMGFHMRPYQEPHPPIAVAASSPNSESLEFAGRMGWWPLSACFLHVSALPSHWEAVERGAAAGGKMVSRGEWRIAREVYVGENSLKAKEEALNGPLGYSFSNYFRPLLSNQPPGIDRFKTDPQTPDEAITAEYMRDNFWIVGDPDECIQKIRELYQHVGGFGTLLPICHDWGRDRKKWFRSLELLADEVLPAVRDLTP